MFLATLVAQCLTLVSQSVTQWVSATLEFWHKECLLRLQTLQSFDQSVVKKQGDCHNNQHLNFCVNLIMIIWKVIFRMVVKMIMLMINMMVIMALTSFLDSLAVWKYAPMLVLDNSVVIWSVYLFLFKIPGDILSDTGCSFSLPAHPETKVF